MKGSHTAWLPAANKAANAAHDCYLAHFRHCRQPAGEFADDFFLVGAQFADVQRGRAKVHAQGGHVLCFVHHSGHMQQGFRWDAADIQAHAAQIGIALNQHHLQAQVCCTKRCRIAAWPGAQHQQVAFAVRSAGKLSG